MKDTSNSKNTNNDNDDTYLSSPFSSPIRKSTRLSFSPGYNNKINVEQAYLKLEEKNFE